MPTAEIDLGDIEKWIAQEAGYYPTGIELKLKGRTLRFRKLRTGEWEELSEVKK